MPVVIIDNYDSFTYNLYQMVQALTEEPVVVYRNDGIGLDGLAALSPSRIILSPGPGHPGVERDFGVCKNVILRQAELGCPVLGVCLGHQGIVHHLGGSVTRAPEIVHGKTSNVRVLEDSSLFDGLSNPFIAMRYHSLVIGDDDLPSVLRVTAREEKNNLPMALQHESQPLYGVQFHPESIGTPEGSQLLRNFLEKC